MLIIPFETYSTQGHASKIMWDIPYYTETVVLLSKNWNYKGLFLSGVLSLAKIWLFQWFFLICKH